MTDMSDSESEQKGNSDTVKQSGIEAELRARIADKESEIAFLRAAFTRVQENEQRALTELSETRRENMVLIAAVATGRIPGYPAFVDPKSTDLRTDDCEKGTSVSESTLPWQRSATGESNKETNGKIDPHEYSTDTASQETTTGEDAPTQIMSSASNHSDGISGSPGRNKLARWWDGVLDVLDRSRTDSTD